MLTKPVVSRHGNIKRSSRALLCALLLMTMVFLSACGTKLTKYRKEISANVDVILEETETLEKTLAKLENAVTIKDGVIYEEQLEVLRDCTDKLITAYRNIAALEAPEEYQQQQEKLKEYTTQLTDTLAAMPELYTLAGASITSELSDEAIARIGDLQRQVAATALTADDYDKILNEVLGFEEE